MSRGAGSHSVTRTYPPHDGPVARVDELKGSGHIYLVQVGPHQAPYSVSDFAHWLNSKYGLNASVLPPMAADPSSWDASRNQYVAELLYEQIKREHADLAPEKDDYLIGFTDADMYSVTHQWSGTFTERDLKRTAIISSDGMQDNRFQLAAENANAANQHLQARLRRILLKDVALLYWHLEINNDPTSLLHGTLDPDLPTEDLYESDLEPDPARSRWGQKLWEPCLFFSYSTKDGMKPLPGPLLRTCTDGNLPDHDVDSELFEVDLRLGLLIDRHLDFDLADTVPIQFQRVTRDGWSGLNPFGISGTDSYDEFLSSADNIRIEVVHADCGRTGLVREPRWLPDLSKVKYVDTDYSGRYYEMRWYAGPFEHYDLKRFDGEVKTYLPCSSPKVLCYQVGYRNALGQELKFERDGSRRLLRLTSPNQSWLRLSYGPDNRISEGDDSRGRTVRYGYDERNRLTSVTYPSGEVFKYEYDGAQHLLTFSVSPDAKTGSSLLRNEYENGRITKQTFADGSVYTYDYGPSQSNQIHKVLVHAPDGRVFNVDVTEGFSTVHEQGLQLDTKPESHK